MCIIDCARTALKVKVWVSSLQPPKLGPTTWVDSQLAQILLAYPEFRTLLQNLPEGEGVGGHFITNHPNWDPPRAYNQLAQMLVDDPEFRTLRQNLTTLWNIALGRIVSRDSGGWEKTNYRSPVQVEVKEINCLER